MRGMRTADTMRKLIEHAGLSQRQAADEMAPRSERFAIGARVRTSHPEQC
jgi:hypothetical protein